MNNYITTKANGEIVAKSGTNTRVPYEHQKAAMTALDTINYSDSYSTLVVLPTGGGKTYTASLWLLKNAIDKKKKILWIAHRQTLLEQAAESFKSYAYHEAIPHISSFNFRIISGASCHDRTRDIRPDDDLIIASKDSLGRNLECLDVWLRGEEEIFLVVDEAHHSTAKTYRRVINYVKSKVKNLKLIGLTATPFRTAEDEQGLLSKIYTDGVKNGTCVHDDIGITYKINLKELISRQILSTPIFESHYTDEEYGSSLGLAALESIQHLDILPDDIASKIADSAPRNKLIVETYAANQKMYGQTILFAVSIDHAIALCALFKKAGIKADYIVSDIKDAATGITIREDNEKKLEEYRNGKIQVLINVNILTEGVDLPQTKTVFLARPTVSSILMTQMVGRALRGTKAGGTSEAYIVSFIDRWNDKIAWVNPESLFEGSNDFGNDDSKSRSERIVRMIAISKIEEFASLLDDSIDTTSLEKVDFEKRIPIGMYAFKYLEDGGVDHSYQVMVYDSTLDAYKKLMEELPLLFDSFGITEEYLTQVQLDEIEEICRQTYFCGEMIPPYERNDVLSILKYYAQQEAAPSFYTFEDIDRNKIDVGKIARHIWDEGMTPKDKAEYINSLWDSKDDNLLRLFFGRKIYFIRQLDLEITKLSYGEDLFEDNNVKYGTKALEDLPLHEIGKVNPEMEKKLRDTAFEKSKDPDGNYCCVMCGKKHKTRLFFQVDHITAMNKGGKSVSENLQILCRSCNAKKSDKQ